MNTLAVSALSLCLTMSLVSAAAVPTITATTQVVKRQAMAVSSSSTNASSASSSSATSQSIFGSGGNVNLTTVVIPLAIVGGVGIVAACSYLIWGRGRMNEIPVVRAIRQPRAYLSRQESGGSVRSLPQYTAQAGDNEQTLVRQTTNASMQRLRAMAGIEQSLPSITLPSSPLGQAVSNVSASDLERGPAVPSYNEATSSRASTHSSDDDHTQRTTEHNTVKNQSSSTGLRGLMARAGLLRPVNTSAPAAPEMVQTSGRNSTAHLMGLQSARGSMVSRNSGSSLSTSSGNNSPLSPLDTTHPVPMAAVPMERSSGEARRKALSPKQRQYLSNSQEVLNARPGSSRSSVHSASTDDQPPSFEEVTRQSSESSRSSSSSRRGSGESSRRSSEERRRPRLVPGTMDERLPLHLNSRPVPSIAVDVPTPVVEDASESEEEHH